MFNGKSILNDKALGKLILTIVPLNPVNLKTVLLSEEVDLNENLLKKSLPDLNTKYFFP